jgi:hypothetical protein
MQSTQSKACDADAALKLADDVQQSTHTAGAEQELAQVKPSNTLSVYPAVSAYPLSAVSDG